MKPTIVNVRGSSGTGKSHVVRAVMERYPTKTAAYVEGRFQPLYYVCDGGGERNDLAVVGHYETNCGGCDTLKSIDSSHDIIRHCAENGKDVIFEGLVVESDCERAIELAKSYDLHVIFLDVSVDVMKQAILDRRAKSDRVSKVPMNYVPSADERRDLPAWKRRLLEEGIPWGMLNTVIKQRTVMNQVPRFRAAKVNVTVGDREACLAAALSALRLS